MNVNTSKLVKKTFHFLIKTRILPESDLFFLLKNAHHYFESHKKQNLHHQDFFGAQRMIDKNFSKINIANCVLKVPVLVYFKKANQIENKATIFLDNNFECAWRRIDSAPSLCPE